VEGPAHLELAAVRAKSPRQLVLYFSEPISASNSRASSFALVNASTQETLEVGSVACGTQELALGLAALSVMAAGHVYDVSYDIAADRNSARAAGKERFVADFYPPDNEVPALKAFHDSSGHLLLLWAPDNRIGNSAMEIWKKSAPDSLRFASLEPNRSAFRTSYEAGARYALKMINEFGASGVGAWASPSDAAVPVFPCLGTCLEETGWDSIPAHFRPLELTCDRLVYFSDSTGNAFVREITEKGVREIHRDSLGWFDTLWISGCR
jgi:hypothetical protein